MIIKNWDDGKRFTANGGLMYWVFWPGSGQNNLTLHYSVLKQGEAFNLHLHESSDDIISIIEGKGVVLTSNSEVPVMKGQSVYVPKGELHGFKNTGVGDLITLGSQSPPDLELYKKGRSNF